MMNFAVWRLSGEDSTKIQSFTASSGGVCVARVACEDMRQEFGVPQVSNEDLRDLATVREVNWKTLSEIANSLFEAGQAKLIELFHVVDISRSDLAARKKEFAWGKYEEFAWGKYDIPESMGIPGPPSKVRFSKFDLERDVVDRMLRLLGYGQFSLSDPNAETESGADLLAVFDDRRIGFQVTQYHSDVGENAGTTGSSLRRQESRKANAGLPTPAFINPLSMPALIHLVREKAKKGWSEKDFPDMRLLIAASIPQSGGTGATFLFEPRLKVDDLNAQLSPILEKDTKYSAAYLYVMMHESVYQWTRERRWKKLL